VVRPASIARHNLVAPSPIRPTNDVLVAPCLATTSAGRVFFFQICFSPSNSLLVIRVYLLLRLYPPSFLPRAHKLRDHHTRSGAGARLHPQVYHYNTAIAAVVFANAIQGRIPSRSSCCGQRLRFPSSSSSPLSCCCSAPFRRPSSKLFPWLSSMVLTLESLAIAKTENAVA
jgi:hypothetical protein